MDIAGTKKFPVSGKGVMQVSVRTRILTIRLIDKVRANPAAAEKIGIVVVNGIHHIRNQIKAGKADNPCPPGNGR